MSASSPSQAKEQDDDTKPLWTYVTKIKSVAGGGNYEIKCNICDFTFNASYTRVRTHLLKMTGKGVRVSQKVTVAKLIDLKKIDNEATLRVERSKTKSVSLPPEETLSLRNYLLPQTTTNKSTEHMNLIFSSYMKDQGGFKEKKIDRKMRRKGDRGRETGLGEGEGRNGEDCEGGLSKTYLVITSTNTTKDCFRANGMPARKPMKLVRTQWQ
ncbi:hypothetical protein JHK86_051008 [Glycine max]|nr:hypothetical protein JHK86_051008 [Glycine max]